MYISLMMKSVGSMRILKEVRRSQSMCRHIFLWYREGKKKGFGKLHVIDKGFGQQPWALIQSNFVKLVATLAVF
ncbi:unnamed protein product [Lathyrus sativus]|nr:unnamed protein product [Lathyrus sativus]